jgi:hypothetical protein
MDNNHITTQETQRSHFTMIPNIVDDGNLDPYSFRLYAHLRRVAGEAGECWQSTETLAEACKMSTGKVSECKGILKEAGLVIVRECSGAGGRYHNIVIVDVWADNAAHYASVHHVNALRSPRETKKNPMKKNHIEEEIDAIASIPQAVTMPPPVSSPGENTSQAETLKPDTPEAELLFARLRATAQAKGYRGPQRFPTLEVKRRFTEAVKSLDGNYQRILNDALGKAGITKLTGVVNYIAKCAESKRGGHITIGR